MQQQQQRRLDPVRKTTKIQVTANMISTRCQEDLKTIDPRDHRLQTTIQQIEEETTTTTITIPPFLPIDRRQREDMVVTTTTGTTIPTLRLHRLQ